MGFDLWETTTVLDFAGTRYRGVEVVVRSDVAIEDYREFIEAADGTAEWEWFRRNVLISWNLERKGQPIPLDTPFGSLPGPFVKKVITGWQTAFVEVDAPLGQPST